MKLIYTSIFLLAFSNISFAQEFFVFPSQGQSQEQIDRDKVECQVWARQQTGFDPLQTPTAIAPPATSGGRQGGILRGGARGAVLGTVTGAITGNTGRGAAIGASSGALIGGFRTADQRRNEQAAQQHDHDDRCAADCHGTAHEPSGHGAGHDGDDTGLRLEA